MYSFSACITAAAGCSSDDSLRGPAPDALPAGGGGTLGQGSWEQMAQLSFWAVALHGLGPRPCIVNEQQMPAPLRLDQDFSC